MATDLSKLAMMLAAAAAGSSDAQCSGVDTVVSDADISWSKAMPLRMASAGEALAA
jgi:hypothetical protein